MSSSLLCTMAKKGRLEVDLPSQLTHQDGADRRREPHGAPAPLISYHV